MPSGGGSSGASSVLVATTNVTAAQLKALHTTGVQLLPAPGVGKATMLLGLFVHVTFGTVAFVDPGTADIAIQSAVSPTANAWIYWEFQNAAAVPQSPGSALFTEPADTYWMSGTPLGQAAAPFTEGATAFANTAIGLVNYAADLTTGDGSARFTLYYATVALA